MGVPTLQPAKPPAALTAPEDDVLTWALSNIAVMPGITAFVGYTDMSNVVLAEAIIPVEQLADLVVQDVAAQLHPVVLERIKQLRDLEEG